MAQVTVGQQVLPIVPNGQHELFVTNLGPNELWYGRDGSVSAQSGQPLDPGNAVQGWPLDQTMYVVAPNGATSVAYESNGSQVAIGAATNVVATLAPGSTVNVGNTVPVSGTVGVAGTVPVSGTVGVAGTVPVSGTVGVSGTTQVAGTVGVSGTAQVAGTVATTGFSDLLYVSTSVIALPNTGGGTNFYDSRTTGGGVTNPGQKYRTLTFCFNSTYLMSGVDTSSGVQIQIAQYTSNGVLMKLEEPQYLGSGVMRYQTEIVGAYFTISGMGISRSVNMQGFTVAGLSAEAPHLYWQTPGNSSVTTNLTVTNGAPGALNKFETLLGTIAASTTGYWFPDTLGGSGTYEAIAYASTSGQDYSFLDAISATYFWRTVPITLLNASGGTRNSANTINFPETPVMIAILNRDAAVRNFEIGLTFA